eukprot:2341941-Rhodomonas_salina.1
MLASDPFSHRTRRQPLEHVQAARDPELPSLHREPERSLCEGLVLCAALQNLHQQPARQARRGGVDVRGFALDVWGFVQRLSPDLLSPVPAPSQPPVVRPAQLQVLGHGAEQVDFAFSFSQHWRQGQARAVAVPGSTGRAVSIGLRHTARVGDGETCGSKGRTGVTLTQRVRSVASVLCRHGCSSGWPSTSSSCVACPSRPNLTVCVGMQRAKRERASERERERVD